MRLNSSYLTLLVMLLCLAAVWAAWQFGAAPLTDYITSKAFAGSESGPAWGHVNMAESDTAPDAPEATVMHEEPTQELTTATSTAEIIESPTREASATPEDTALPSPTQPQSAPTSTNPAPTRVIPTLTNTFPAPTATQVIPTIVPPTATLSIPATQDMSVTEAPSPTPLPTDTGVPQATQRVGATPDPGNANAGDTGRWIDVDLTNQMLYAYEGNTVVNSFIVSTGTWNTPTVTGQYRVYVKYPYTDMSGPGYYLPNVPNTMYFYQGYALHGTYWHNNFGTPMSHGCVNLSIPDSAWVFNFASVGTLVNVHY